MPDGNFLEIRGVRVKEDAYGNICLNDLWRLAGEPSMKTPPRWKDLPTSKRLIAAFIANIEKFDVKTKNRDCSAIYSKKGNGGGTYAHHILALAYAEHLSDDLALDVRKTYLRVRSGDLTLIQEIHDRAEEAKKFSDTRDISKEVRNKYTATLVNHGAKSAIGYCTDAIYQVLLGGTKQEIVVRRNLPEKVVFRDELPIGELLQTMNTEYLASERIEDLGLRGKEPCASASRRAAHFVKQAFENERADRRQGEG